VAPVPQIKVPYNNLYVRISARALWKITICIKKRWVETQRRNSNILWSGEGKRRIQKKNPLNTVGKTG